MWTLEQIILVFFHPIIPSERIKTRGNAWYQAWRSSVTRIIPLGDQQDISACLNKRKNISVFQSAMENLDLSCVWMRLMLPPYIIYRSLIITTWSSASNYILSYWYAYMLITYIWNCLPIVLKSDFCYNTCISHIEFFRPQHGYTLVLGTPSSNSDGPGHTKNNTMTDCRL